MFLEALDKILNDQATGAAIRRLEAGEPDGPGQGLWPSIAQAGFLDLLRSEAQGGAALSPQELFPLLECLGRHAVPLPIAQTIVARGLLPGHLELPADAMVTLATQAGRTADGRLRCLSVPGGQVASHVMARDAAGFVLLACDRVHREPAGDPRNLVAHLTWPDSSPLAQSQTGGEALTACAAALSAALLSGAMQRAFEMSLNHCNTRIQFGKSIGKFQAIQHQISVMAEHVLAGSLAAESAFRQPGLAPSLLAAAVAKSRTSEAAGLVAATAHAVHGAMGMTDEFDLSIVTRRLHGWRAQYGAEAFWSQFIGDEILGGDLPLADFVRSL